MKKKIKLYKDFKTASRVSCSNCKSKLSVSDNYCSSCGQQRDWQEKLNQTYAQIGTSSMKTMFKSIIAIILSVITVIISILRKI